MESKTYIYASSVIRGSHDPNVSGSLFKIDWKDKKILNKVDIPMYSTKKYGTSQGGHRGGRGIHIKNNIVYMATSTSIIKYSLDLKKLGEIYNKKFCGIHEIFIDDSGIWVTSTIHDTILKVDFSGKILFEWHGGSDSVLMKKLKYKRRIVKFDLNFPRSKYRRLYDKYVEGERLHLNTVQVFENKAYAFSCRRKSLIKIFPGKTRIVFRDRNLEAPHNCVFVDKNKIIVNNTKKQELNCYSLQPKKLLFKIKSPTSVIPGCPNPFSVPGWQRGLARMHGDTYVVGTSPLSVFSVNLNRKVILETMVLSNDISQCIHGLFAIRR